MRPLAPNTDKGRTVTGDDVHHKTRDTTPGWAVGKAKAMRHAARQEARAATMPVETATGTEQRPIDTVRIDRHGQRVEPTLRPGEEAFHSIDGRCHVIDTGNRN